MYPRPQPGKKNIFLDRSDYPENTFLTKENSESTVEAESSTTCSFISQMSLAGGFTGLPDLVLSAGGCTQTTWSCVCVGGCVSVFRGGAMFRWYR